MTEAELNSPEIQPNVFITVDRVAKEIVQLVNKSGVKVDITIPDTLDDGTKLARLALNRCVGEFGTVKISDGISDVGYGCFLLTANIEKIIWSNGCNRIPDRCFVSRGIKEVTNISHVVSVGEGAFGSCGIKKLTWPDNCKEIPDNAFQYSSLEHIENIENVTKIGKRAFCFTDIESFTVPKKITSISSGMLKGSKCSEIILHRNVTNIKDSAFSGTKIKTFKWPEKCSTIPKGCFSCCKELTSVEGLSKVKKIKDAAFKGCEKLTVFDWPEACTEIPERCFSEC